MDMDLRKLSLAATFDDIYLGRYSVLSARLIRHVKRLIGAPSFFL